MEEREVHACSTLAFSQSMYSHHPFFSLPFTSSCLGKDDEYVAVKASKILTYLIWYVLSFPFLYSLSLLILDELSLLLLLLLSMK